MCFKISNGLSISPWEDPWIPWVNSFIPKTKEGIDGKVWSTVANLRLEEASNWDVELLQAICDRQVVEEIQKVELPQVHCHD